MLEPYDLRCEYLVTPLGMDEQQPRLSWRLRSSRRGDRPTAARVTVERRGTSGLSTEQCWDSGWRPDASSMVTYGGQPFQSATRYSWSLRVLDADGIPSRPVASWFETGLLNASDWGAEWIARNPEDAGPAQPPGDADAVAADVISHLNRRLPPCAYLRRPFSLEGDLVRGRLYITARGLYEARLNGKRVGDQELAPGWTDYNVRIQYQCYDVTPLLVAGSNVLGVILGDGWYSGRVGPGGRRLGEHYGTVPQLLAQLQIDFADGQRQIVTSDPRWLTSSGPLRFSDLLAGEYYDARRGLTGWDQPGYDAGHWQPAMSLGSDSGAVIASSDEPVRAVELRKVASLRRLRDDAVLADFGQNMVGRVRLTLRDSPPGSRIVIRHGEALTDDGDLYTANLRLAAATDTYVAAGQPVEVFEPRFTFHGFRYVTVTGYPGELQPGDLVGVVLHNDVARAGQLETSDANVNKLVSNIWWSERGNMISIPTDCPQRDERLGWLADAQVFLPTACYFADVAAFFARWMRDVISSRLPGGAFPDVAPRVVFERTGAPGWGDAGVIVPWHLWRAYGDRRVLERSYPAMAAWVAWIRASNPDLIWRHAVGNHYGDWLAPDDRTPRDVLATAYFAHSAELVSRTARVLGFESAADEHARLAEDIRNAFVAAFVSPDGKVAGGTQTSYLLALAFGLMPGNLVQQAAGHLAADITSRGNRLSTGFLGTSLLCPVLTEHGRADLAYALLHNEASPSWMFPIAQGATTIWERWDGWTPERGFQAVAMNSFNHAALGSVGEWLFGSVGGIRQAPESVGFAELDIAPVPGKGLTWARCRYETCHGLVETSWRIDGSTHALSVLVPPGSEATISVPARDPAGVTEGGLPLDKAPGVEVTGEAPGAVRCHVGSGRYEFRSAW